VQILGDPKTTIEEVVWISNALAKQFLESTAIGIVRQRYMTAIAFQKLLEVLLGIF
jgi:hypothetical protein